MSSPPPYAPPAILAGPPGWRIRRDACFRDVCAHCRLLYVPQGYFKGPRHANRGVLYSDDPEGRIHADNFPRHVRATRVAARLLGTLYNFPSEIRSRAYRRASSADHLSCGPRLFQSRNRGPQKRRSALPCSALPALPRPGGWRIRHDAFCRDVCAPLDRIGRSADVPLLSTCASQGCMHPGIERRDVCGTRPRHRASGHKSKRGGHEARP